MDSCNFVIFAFDAEHKTDLIDELEQSSNLCAAHDVCARDQGAALYVFRQNTDPTNRRHSFLTVLRNRIFEKLIDASTDPVYSVPDQHEFLLAEQASDFFSDICHMGPD